MPAVQGAAIYRKAQSEFVFKGVRLGYPIKGDIPIMLEASPQTSP